MFIINLGGSHVPDVSAITDSIPPPSAAERAQFDVAKETEVLYGVYLELTRKSQSEGIPEAASLGRLFAKTTWRWWTMTGGWENVDKRISGKYDPLFIVFVGAAHSMLSGMKAVALERKQKDTQKNDPANSGSIFGPSHQPRDNQRPFDKVGATRALFQVAQHINSSPDSESAVAKALFEHLAGVWWYETGGPARIHKDVLASFPGWFVGKLSTSRPQQNASRLAPKDSLQFDVDKETRSLFEMAKKRLPRAPLGMEVVFYDFGLDREFTCAILRWFDNTGGWKNVDKAIRDQYPKWFVDYIANIAKLAPAAKKLASQF
ncbi:hsp88-like protein [Pseudozyma hubeiensis SY62]|uniref:Hsp88-like protein n=1 Tax=Pseudozyma hubeiensis (strain SY62) TaxID=1305764 RepID=R9NYE5_PSEHS|nr:hsp88-like protein [Pseudozyma hubeiensis SY62]GAC93686.1 hsp88-like protein [Pseudozyma hubeiensis SY62]